MDLKLSIKLTPTSGDTVLARDILTNKAVEIPITSLGGGGSGLELGEPSSTAYRGDRGKIAYDHSQTTGNPHNTTKNDIGLSNVDNTSDLNKPISTATQTALDSRLNKGSYPGNASDLKSLIDAKISGTVTADYIPKATATGTIGNSIIYENVNGIGIGTNTIPSGYKLVVQGNTLLYGGIYLNGTMAIVSANATTGAFDFNYNSGGTGSLNFFGGTTTAVFSVTNAGATTAKSFTDEQGKLKSQRVITITGNITLSETHNGAILHVTNTCNITIPTGLDANFQCVIFAKGSIIVTFVNGGVTINSPSGLLLKTDKMASLFASASNTFNLLGELATS